MEMKDLKWKLENVVNMPSETLTSKLNEYDERVKTLESSKDYYATQYNAARKKLETIQCVVETLLLPSY